MPACLLTGLVLIVILDFQACEGSLSAAGPDRSGNMLHNACTSDLIPMPVRMFEGAGAGDASQSRHALTLEDCMPPSRLLIEMPREDERGKTRVAAQQFLIKEKAVGPAELSRVDFASLVNRFSSLTELPFQEVLQFARL